MGLLTAAILTFITPIPLPMPVLSSLVILVTTGILLLGKYRLLDSLSKIIMIVLTVTTVSAVVIAFMRNGIHGVAAPDFVPPSPWELSKLAFLVALMGWMPAPIEISAINSMWVVAKTSLDQSVLSRRFYLTSMWVISVQPF